MSLCLVVFCALTLKLPLQASLSVAPKLPISLHSGEKWENFRKTSTPLDSDFPQFGLASFILKNGAAYAHTKRTHYD